MKDEVLSANPPGMALQGRVVNLRANAAQTRLVGWMVLAIIAVAVLGYWDEQRQAEMALDGFAQEQANLAACVSAEVGARLDAAKRDAMRIAEDAASSHETAPGATEVYANQQLVATSAPRRPLLDSAALVLRIPVTEKADVELTLPASDLLHNAARIAKPNELMLAILPPGGGLRTSDGRALFAPSIEGAFHNGQAVVRLTRPEAAQLGLPARTAMAGIAVADGGPMGRFGVVVVASAARERDRQIRARYRLLLGVLLTGGLVLSFGTLALRKQRKELGLMRDLEIAELQQRRDERLDRASRAAMVGTLAAGVAHEISTPLGVISGRAEQLLGRFEGDDRGGRAVAAILEQTGRIKEIVRGFLDFARVGRPTYTTVLPSDLAMGAARLVEHRFEKSGVLLGVEADRSLSAIHCDMLLLEQAIVNLLLNACEACERGGKVDLVVRALRDRLAFIVVDNGSGIASSDVSRVTEPFFTTKPPGKGAGLGLAITNEIVRGHRGTLTLAPAPTGGTRATIEIPIEQDTDAPQDGATPAS